ncbi:MAG: hypothetical protein WCK92_13750 [Bacteroidota bacterium]
MNKLPFVRILLAVFTLSCIGMTSCKKNFERLVAVKTTSISSVNYLAQGEVIDVGGLSPEYGFCYGSGSNPDLSGPNIKLGTTSSPKSFQTTMDLSPGTYYVRAYAKSSQGTVYGDNLKFFVSGGDVEYYWDNGVADYGWRWNPGYDGHMGNLFPVTTSGTIKSVKMYFFTAADAGYDQLNMIFINQNGYVMDSTSYFLPPANDWYTISGLNIPFSGNFMAVVHWNKTASPTNYLGMDQSGPNAYMDLAYELKDGAWVKLSTNTGGNMKAGVFLIHVTAQVTKNKNGVAELTELLPGPGKFTGSIHNTPAKNTKSPSQAKPFTK